LTPDASGKDDGAVRLAVPVIVCACLLVAAPASPQTPGPASFRIYEKGKMVGTMETAVERTADGWRVRGSSRFAGSVPVTIPNLDLYYDRSWRGRFMTLEMKAPDDAIVHVAVVGETTRTDIVRATEARFRSNSVSPDTIFVPERAYGAYEAVAARLAAAVPVADLPLFIPPFGETRMLIADVVDEVVTTAKGTIAARRYSLTELRQRPTPVEVWVVDGRLLRLELPRESLAVVRSDIAGP
jgi:hypothetical protein